MSDATLEGFRQIAATMNAEPADWQWIGVYMSQRHFGITKTRALEFVRRHGGEAGPMPNRGADVSPRFLTAPVV